MPALVSRESGFMPTLLRTYSRRSAGGNGCQPGWWFPLKNLMKSLETSFLSSVTNRRRSCVTPFGLMYAYAARSSLVAYQLFASGRFRMLPTFTLPAAARKSAVWMWLLMLNAPLRMPTLMFPCVVKRLVPIMLCWRMECTIPVTTALSGG